MILVIERSRMFRGTLQKTGKKEENVTDDVSVKELAVVAITL